MFTGAAGARSRAARLRIPMSAAPDVTGSLVARAMRAPAHWRAPARGVGDINARSCRAREAHTSRDAGRICVEIVLAFAVIDVALSLRGDRLAAPAVGTERLAAGRLLIRLKAASDAAGLRTSRMVSSAMPFHWRQTK